MENNQKEIIAVLFGILTAGVSAFTLLSYKSDKAANSYKHYTSYTQTTQSVSCNTEATEATVAPNVASYTTTTTIPEDTTPYYSYQNRGVHFEYDRDVQREVFNQWRAFKGELPPYKTVLSLWIASSGLEPTAFDKDSGCVGIPQLSPDSIDTCTKFGWYDPSVDDLSTAAVQVRLGLLILNKLCQEYPGGDWDYYRAIRASFTGGAELLRRESEGKFGDEEGYTVAADGELYPGFYGKVKDIELSLEYVK